MLRIAYFTDTFAPEVNGVTKTLSRLNAYLENHGIEKAFFAPDYMRDSQPEIEHEENNPEIHRYKGIKTSLSPHSCLAFPKTKDIYSSCDAFAPDLIHVVTEFGIGFKGMKYASSRKLPLVMSYHTDYTHYLKYFKLDSLDPFINLYLKWFYGFANKILVPSDYMLEQLQEKKYNNLGIWSRGIDTNHFNKSYRSQELRETWGIGQRFAFLYVGRLSPEKGLDVLLKAVEVINRDYPGKAVFVFTGDGPYADIIRDKGYDNVIMTGFKQGRDLSEIYASCDAFAFPSGTETFGNAPLEAMASGLPIISVNRGGVTEFLKHDRNALLCEDGDSQDFIHNMEMIMQDVELAKNLSEEGIITASKRSWEKIFEGLLEDYQEVIKENKSSYWGYVS